MSEPESPVLRLIPYLAAITAAVFITLPRLGDGNLLITLLYGAVAYFGAYYIVKLIIHVIITRFDAGDGEQQP
ncbi:hypothetical protein D3I60_09840 [Brevibacterium permense]|uniref:hypothetical protein n=1 Tax=Brevibacterium permense TaxID=234834 RepID=UPI0021D263B6|nr:hypothetical protein [Brevibacterium permense]MCU4297377.1 hypothetical protein [Brevibacterium permense]